MSDSNQQIQLSRGDVLSRRYEIEKELGSGMIGATYLARHISSGKHLCIKVLRAGMIEGAPDREHLEEAFTAAREVKHDGLIKLGEVGEHNGTTYFTEEYFPSQNLRQLIDEYQSDQKSFTLQEACQIAVNILEALSALHGGELLHRNLKPENVLVHSRKTGPGGKIIVRTVKVTDAGISGMINPTVFAQTYINRSEAKYLAPELGGFGHGGTPQSDIYSVGVMLYELLVGQPPRGTYLSPTQLRGDLPEHIDDVVENALGANPEDRYPSARDMINDIQRVFTTEIDEVRAGPNVRNVAIGVGVGLLVLTGVGVWLTQRDAPDPVEDARIVDHRLRNQIAARTKTPTDDEIRQKTEAHREMLYIPPGPFLMGRLNQEDVTKVASRSEPVVKEITSEGFYIDRFEFPNRLQDKDGKPVRPVAKVSWNDASEACESLGKRLCTEEEWEKACKGPANWIYSYGDSYDEEMCGRGIDATYHLGDAESCVSGYGVMGMSGGPREWTGSATGTKGTRRVVKGGLRANNERGSRCAFAVDESATYADTTLSFRCCLGDTAAPAPTAPAAPGAPKGDG